MTVDLIGSTAFKFASRKASTKEPHPEWVKRFRQFYLQFPETLQAKFKNTESGRLDGDSAKPAPQVWKTVGDEILFCCRVYDVQHLACAVSAFLQSLEAFGKELEANEVPLDVKGAGWLAAFPAENISIEIFNGVTATGRNEDVLSEEFERGADTAPNKYDFLGPGIDTGFRVSKNATADRFTASIGLAYQLCQAAHHNMFSGNFEYHGRERFKGVNQDQPYPVVSIGSERDPQKRELRERERLISNERLASPVALRDFLSDFMKHEKIDMPMLPMLPGDTLPSPPASYQNFRDAWDQNVKENTERDRGLDEAAAAEKSEGNANKPIPADVRRFANRELRIIQIPVAKSYPPPPKPPTPPRPSPPMPTRGSKPSGPPKPGQPKK
jgi:hypothetical protein